MPYIFSTLVLSFLFVFSVIGQSITQANAQDKVREIEITENADYFGFDLRAEKDVSLDECKAICIGDSQ